ncbi:hypothetical protein [Mesorhizobium sp.]|uniref:hypothetical protein n=1 Tax=Mesorhizobium sp. TaxID=1871066 RepID=UPI000FE83778|nr:hypothetical protein [Mesorhizobium sp.]RWF32415.1 MAG: hypothetical protein EOS45_06770 [Mesorhizobium sp.]
MVASVGSISIDLSTNAQKFATGFKSAATTVESQSARMAKSVAAVERGVSGIGSTLKTFVGGLAAGAGIAALASLGGAFEKLKETISEYDEIATNAKQSGLKADTYQALAFAAKQANVEQDAFNSSLTIFAKNAGLAEKGTGALYAGLQKLNPQLLQNIVNAKDQEERLKLVSDALAQTTDATQKAALAAVVFGKGGVEMARFLDQGRSSIDAIKKSAKDLGIIVPDELLARAGELDDKLDVLAKVIHVQLGEALINLAPGLTGAMQGFADLSKEINATSQAINNFVNNPSLENFAAILGDKIIPGSFIDKLSKGELIGRTPDVAELTTAIDFVKTKLAELQDQAAHGIDVHIEIDDATKSLDDLETQLRRIQIQAQAAANNSAGSIAALVESANKALSSTTTAAKPVLPNVTRYGGDPNKIELPDRSSSYQSNVNESGVGVRSYGADPYSKDTAEYTEDTADNVTSLDRNTKGYFRSLSSDMSGYTAQTNLVINKLSDVTAQAFAALPSSILAAVVQNNDSGATGTGKTMFGDSYDSQYGSYISSWGVGKVKRPGLTFPTTSSDGKYDTSVNVQQPGSDITLNYYAAAGESAETAKQRARDMYNELVLQASRA